MNAQARIPFPRAMTPEMRQNLERVVDRLLAVLDGADMLAEDLEPNDGGEDYQLVGIGAEDDDREPWLGWTATGNQTAPQWAGGAEDREDGDDTGIADALSINPDDEDTHDRESAETDDNGLGDRGGAFEQFPTTMEHVV